jgi:hypothetical protein
MGRAEGVLYIFIYFLMLIFGGIALLMSEVFTPIFTMTDPISTLMIFLFSIGLFFIGIPYLIWVSKDKD